MRENNREWGGGMEIHNEEIEEKDTVAGRRDKIQDQIQKNKILD